MNEITVIPMTNEALQSVTTPLVTFEQPFPERPSRLERQVEAFREGVPCVLLADTWPDAKHHAMSWHLQCAAVDSVGVPVHARNPLVWPETALYKTGVAQLYEIDEVVQYRPHMHFFCQLRDNIKHHWISQCNVSAEAAIVVPDRGVYDPGFSHPPVTFPEQTKQVTGILLVDHLTKVHVETIQSWQRQTGVDKELIVVHCSCPAPDVASAADIVIDAGDAAPSDAVNEALKQAHGEYVMLVDPAAVCLRERLVTQYSAGFDISIMAPKGYVPFLHTHGMRAGEPTSLEYAIMFRRRVFERTGGMYPGLPVGYIYDKYCQAQQEQDFVFGVVHDQMIGSIDYPLPYGEAYTQNVYNDVFRRRMLQDGEAHAWHLLRRR